MRLLEAIGVLAADLPDPGTFSIVAVAGAAGTLIGGAIPRLRRLPAERIGPMTGTGTWAGIGIGFAVWFAAIAIDRL